MILAFHPHKVGGLEVLNGELGGVERGSVEVVIGDERKVGNDGGGEVVAGGADILDEAVCGTGLAEVVELFKVVINGFLGAKGGSEKVGPLEEGVTWSSGGSTVADFSHPPFGDIVEEAGGGNGEPVGKGHVVEVEGLVDVVVEVVGVEEVGEGVLLEAVMEEGVVCAVEEGVLWPMLSTESVRMSDMLMEDAVISGEEGVEDAAETDVEDDAAAVATAAATASAAALWEFLVWRGGMWR
ncbi:hypothetical protein CBR_g75380 [Chara braunii]|uniref:Uncharacterized protein n=1 Tax=Chara braunii TaxID=69332 RepID=A0A388JJJ2_CHABU|nr:hypothetical protein CBR_g75380 [Chara braunii]|eukprot:GBG42028.1 hypothetical protein CBR_g75380 [Chara braunii]